MSKSLDFCKTVSSDPSRSTYSDRDWSKAVESMNTEAYFDKTLDGHRNVIITRKYGKSNTIVLKLRFHFDSDADFDYFTSEVAVHDGTLLFVQDAIMRCTERVLYGLTCNKEMKRPMDGDTIEYTIGNFVILDEYNKQSFSADKPYLCSRTTVLLPLKYRLRIPI